MNNIEWPEEERLNKVVIKPSHTLLVFNTFVCTFYLGYDAGLYLCFMCVNIVSVLAQSLNETVGF